MKPSQSKEDRQLSQAERGLAAQRIVDDELIEAWFRDHRQMLIVKMLSAGIDDHTTRQAAAIEVKILDQLRTELTTQASLGRRAIEDIEKRKTKQ